MAQYRAHHDMAKRCELARRFVIGKLSNQRTLLQRYQRQRADPAMGVAIEQIADLLAKLANLPVDQPRVVQQVASGDNGVEGTPCETILRMEGPGGAAHLSSSRQPLSDREQL